MCPDIMSTGFSGAERAGVKIGDTVAVFALGPIGLCAVAGAKLMGATTIIGVETIPARIEVARRLGADHIVDFKAGDPVEQILALTDRRGVDVAIEALGTQQTVESALRVLRPGGILSSPGVYSGDLRIPFDAFAAGLGDLKIVTTLCPEARNACAERAVAKPPGEGEPLARWFSESRKPAHRVIRWGASENLPTALNLLKLCVCATGLMPG